MGEDEKVCLGVSLEEAFQQDSVHGSGVRPGDAGRCVEARHRLDLTVQLGSQSFGAGGDAEDALQGFEPGEGVGRSDQEGGGGAVLQCSERALCAGPAAVHRAGVAVQAGKGGGLLAGDLGYFPKDAVAQGLEVEGTHGAGGGEGIDWIGKGPAVVTRAGLAELGGHSRCREAATFPGGGCGDGSEVSLRE